MHDLLTKRYETQKAFFEEGRITVDRYLESIDQLGDAEKSMARTKQDRIAAQQRTTERVNQLLEREKAVLNQGSTIADVSEVEVRQLQLDLELSRMKRNATGSSTKSNAGERTPSVLDDPEQIIESEKPLLDELLRYATQRYEVARKSFEKGLDSFESLLDPIKQLSEVEKTMARTQKDRVAAQTKALEGSTQLSNQVQVLFKAGAVTGMTVNAVEFLRLQLKLELAYMTRAAGCSAEESNSGTKPVAVIVPDQNPINADHAEVTALKKRVDELEIEAQYAAPD